MSLKRAMLCLVLIVFIVCPVFAVQAKNDEVSLRIIELVHEEGNKKDNSNAILPSDDSMSNPNYKLLPFRWYTTAKIWINPSNKYGFRASGVESVITSSATTWDEKTTYDVFLYQTTSKDAGKFDGYNVVSFGAYRAGVIAVTYIWYKGDRILETDTRLNTFYKWSLTGEKGKMDVQNIVTHEFGHWAGLDDLYSNTNYWLTMYGYADYGETYKRDLGLGDIYGLKKVYGS